VQFVIWRNISIQRSSVELEEIYKFARTMLFDVSRPTNKLYAGVKRYCWG